MSGYYPDGVTGNEYAIAGADREYEANRNVYCHNEDCADFEVEVDLEVSLASYRDNEWGTFTCPTCKTQGEYEGEVEIEEDDPDRYRD
jgi:hypothetical protein